MKEKNNIQKISTELIAFETYFDLHKQNYKGIEFLALNDVIKLFDTSLEKINEILREESDRFPSDFVFVIEEKNKKDLAFTLAGLLMLAGQIRNERADKISVQLIELLVSRKPNIGFDLVLGKDIE